MKEAKKMAEKGAVKDYVHQFPSTEEVHRGLKPKPTKLAWKISAKDTWTADVDGEKVPARIKELDKKTFVVYRNGNYLGGEPTLELAKMRVDINAMSQRNAVMRLWEKENPGLLPPFLQLTEEERRVYWERNPPVRTIRASPTIGTMPKEDAATRRIRESLAQEGGGAKPGKVKAARSSEDRVVPEGTIKVLNSTNPKKAGSGAFARWAKLFAHDGKTVKEYAAAGGNLTTLENAIAKKNVEVK